jgi:hypothetical protein
MDTDLHQSYAPEADNMYRALLMPEQPFSFANDVTLTGVRDPAGNYFVRVDRLYGNEVNEFTMVNVQKSFPATAPPDVPRAITEDVVDALPIPYAFSEKSGTRHPSVSTQTSVYFAVNPSLAMFAGFASGCYTKAQVYKTQLSALSSYAPIRIWKIDPYTYCPVGDDGTKGCNPGHVSFVDIPGAFTNKDDSKNVFDFDKCDIPFSVEVTQLEYLNEENIAVTILEAPFTEYSLETGALNTNATIARHRIMYLSTSSIPLLSDSPHNRDQNDVLVQGQLCAGMRKFPNLGSIVAETTCSWINLLRPVVSIIGSIPGLIEIWRNGKPCALATHGHSVLQRCGAELLSLDDFFDSINRANTHYWAAFNLIARAVRGTKQHQLANIVDGVAYYGDATSSPVGPLSQIISSVRIPLSDIGSTVLTRVFPFTPSEGLAVTSNPVKMAQFSYQLVVGCITDIIPLAIRVDRNPSDIDAIRALLLLFMNRVFQARDAYYQSITQGVMKVVSP